MKTDHKAAVLYISYDGMTDPLGQSQVLPYLCGLSQLGYQITLLSCEKEENFLIREAKIAAITRQHGIEWVPIPYTKRPPVLSTLWDVRQLGQSAIALHRRHRFRIVHCRSYIAALIGLQMQQKFGCRFIFDMRGFWADERVDGGLWKLNHPVYKVIYRYFKRKEKEFLQKADYTISLTENAKIEIRSWELGKDSEVKIEVIPCCVDTSLFAPGSMTPAQKAALRSSLGISPDDFVLSYLGAIGTWYLLDEMLDFYHRLFLKIPASKFLLITAEDPSSIFQKAEQKGIPARQLVVRRVERTEVPLYISLSHCAVFFIKPAYSKKASSPTKQGELMSMGVPVVCNTGVGDTDHVVTKYKSGILLDSFERKSLDEAVNHVLQLNSDQEEHIRQGALDFYSLEGGINKYAEVYQRLVQKA